MYKKMGGDRNTGRDRVIRKKIEMDDDKLIELVRRNPSLYELDHSNYGSGVSRAKTWKAIGAELKRHPLFCKKRWGNIRDNYKKAMKKYNWRVAQGYTSAKKYKFFDKLEFLANQISEDNYIDKDNDNDNNDHNNKTECSNETSLEVKCEPDIDPEYDDKSLYDNNYNQEYQNQQYYDDYFDQPVEAPSMQSHYEPINHHNNEEETRTEQIDNYSQADTRVSECEGIEEVDKEHDNDDDDEEDESAEVYKLPSAKIETYTNSTHLGLPRRKRKLQESDCELSSNSKSMRYIVERVESDRFVERHPVDAFLSGIAPTLKSLSAYYLSLAKTQIYSIVQEYEMAMIMEKRNENHRL
ncbi:uncharacterized protein LOC129916992 [Episyrphus balteatus]|uniref:uncharacterized protein LOC129916992 n=1 Tax=Episyrphus balteatus TaxID=286459 RepID=UPI0024859458|nr:uncharacterized protein LOC129916992 [Episyrphus balteatus]